MLERKIYGRLLEWKDKGDKPLLVYGQRQIGKTFILDRFAKDNFGTYIYADLSRDRRICNVFRDDDQSADHIIDSICIIRGIKEIDSDDTVIFLDEIQECPAARSALKTFALDGRYRIIASGSMLGVSDRIRGTEDHDLIPMGYEELVLMHGLDFEEFLWANGIPKKAAETVRECIKNCRPIGSAVYDRLRELFRIFQITGGMPASVQAYVNDKGHFSRSSEILDSIIVQCRNDINRYNTSVNAVKTSECFSSIPAQLADTNKKYQYSRIDNGRGSRKSAEKYMENLLWIRDAGYGNFCYGLRQITRPVAEQIKRDVFKVYLSDTGVLIRMYGEDALKAVYESDTSFNSGAITENIVAECLMKSGIRPLYYQNNNGKGRMEIDFILDFIGGPAAVEVKSGKDRNSPSLSRISEYWDVKRRIKLEDGNIFRDEDGIEHYPLFAAAFIDVLNERPDYLK